MLLRLVSVSNFIISVMYLAIELNSYYVTFYQVTETANFKKDLCLDSLDRVELVMAFEEEFSIEIPEEKGDKLTCCADVAKYILTETKQNDAPNSWCSPGIEMGSYAIA